MWGRGQGGGEAERVGSALRVLAAMIAWGWGQSRVSLGVQESVQLEWMPELGHSSWVREERAS